ncbi:hypothetical protein SAMN04488020_103319 [Palleronia marisminoris]|uniref:Uncharacterized protein n=1 Tax=Palleronia marisminoris TaxID=315423 RepID=A0A1Y5SDB7_9RHOB|nr:hypothetical protein [Palleronia marisminoris]SFG73094.1 hypothetical protein SAMN04488020_103319 [Palleronia marisminoris]SLN37422.1 hypothetical protein PAM7066_01601 [Palleronia marisminoris]
MTIFEIAIETRFAAADECGGVGCVVYGMFDDDIAPEYDLEFAAHLPEPVGAFGTLAVCVEALAALRGDVRPGDHIDIALPTSIAAITVDTLGAADAAEMLDEFSDAVADLRRSGIGVRVTRHDRANEDSLARAAALAELAVDVTALAAFEAKRD